jgi:LacI family transcriptional regulator, galactose operon repressor
MPHTADVAKRARVAVATVPNGSGPQLRGVRSRLIGMLATDLKDDFQLKIARHVEAAASAAGRAVLHCQTLGAVDRELAHLESFQEMGAEGVVVVSVGDVTAQLLRMEAAGIVSVVINPETPTPFPSVGVDDEAGGHLAVNHLVDQGCRNIAFVSSDLGRGQVGQRLAGAALAANWRGAHLEVLNCTALTVTDGTRVATSIAARRSSDRPDGIITTSDDLALGIMQELATRGISTPGDIAVIGWDDTDVASRAPVPLTSVRQPAAAVGAMAFGLLCQRIEQGTTVQQPGQLLELFPDLIVRNSSLRALDRRTSGHR